MLFSVQILRVMLPFFRLPCLDNMDFTDFFNSKREKDFEIGHFRNITFMVYIIIKI